MKLQGIKAINWFMYKQHCLQYGLSMCQFENLKSFIEERKGK